MESIRKFLDDFLKRRTAPEELVQRGILHERPDFEEIGLVFRRPLEQVAVEDGVPVVIARCCNWLLQDNRIAEEGIFRVPGDGGDILRLKREFDAEGAADFTSSSVASVAGVLKLYLREMPEPLFLFCLYDDFVQATRFHPGDDVLEHLCPIMKSLPPHHLNLAIYLLQFLHKVSQLSLQNLMPVDNLAMVFAPNVMKSKNETLTKIMEDSSHVKRLLRTMIENSLELAGLFPTVDLPPPSAGNQDTAPSSAEEPDCESKRGVSRLESTEKMDSSTSSKPSNESKRRSVRFEKRKSASEKRKSGRFLLKLRESFKSKKNRHPSEEEEEIEIPLEGMEAEPLVSATVEQVTPSLSSDAGGATQVSSRSSSTCTRYSQALTIPSTSSKVLRCKPPNAQIRTNSRQPPSCAPPDIPGSFSSSVSLPPFPLPRVPPSPAYSSTEAAQTVQRGDGGDSLDSDAFSEHEYFQGRDYR